jgi:hypothetical protein
VDSVPGPILIRKSGSAGNRSRTLGSVARNSDHYTAEAVYFLLHNIYKFGSYLTGSTIHHRSVASNSDDLNTESVIINHVAVVGLERGPLILVSITEELLDREVAAPVYKSENTAVGIRHADHVAPSVHKKLAITSPSSVGRSIGIVHSWNETTNFSLDLDKGNFDIYQLNVTRNENIYFNVFLIDKVLLLCIFHSQR